MLCEVPLTKEQQAFATDHHGLVYKFLNENHLPEDEFYDVIIFGYLRAVYRYFNEPKLQKYSFATIGWKSMQGALSNYNRYQSRRKLWFVCKGFHNFIEYVFFMVCNG